MTTLADELEFYEQQLDELRRGRLATVRATAARWATLMTATLGVFGTASFAGGLRTVDKLAAPFDSIAKALTTLAAATALTAVVYLARAAGGLRLEDLSFPNGRTLMNRETQLANVSRRHLRVGRRFAVATGAIVLAGSAFVLWCPTAKPTPSKVLVRFPDGAACGAPTAASGGQLTVGGRPLRDAVEIVPVAVCPKATR